MSAASIIEAYIDHILANQEVELKALEKYVTVEQPAKFQPVNSGDYIRRSLQAVYSKPHIEINNETIELRA